MVMMQKDGAIITLLKFILQDFSPRIKLSEGELKNWSRTLYKY